MVEMKESNRQAWICAIGTILVSMCFGLGSNGVAMYITSMSEALDIPRAVFSTYDIVRMITSVSVAALFGPIYSKIGAKGAAFVGGISFVIMLTIWSFATNIWMIWLGSIFYGAGYVLLSALLIFTVLPSWFPEKIGTIGGVASAGMSMVTSPASLAISYMVTTYSYNLSLRVTALLILVVTIIGVLMIKTHPDDPIAGERAKKEAKTEGRASVKVNYKELLSSPIIWMCSLVFLFNSGIAHGVSLLIPTVAVTKGLGVEVGAAAYAIVFLILPFTKIFIGFLRDKVGMYIPMCICYGSLLIAIILLYLSEGNATMYQAVGVFHGIGVVMGQIFPPLILLQATGKYYTAAMLGIGQIFYNVARAIFTPLTQIGFDRTGSYDGTFILWMVLTVFTFALCFLTLQAGKKYVAKRDAQLGN